MQKIKLEYFDDLSVGVRILYGKDFLEFEDIPYEKSDASAVMKFLSFLSKNNIISISCKDPESLNWLDNS